MTAEDIGAHGGANRLGLLLARHGAIANARIRAALSATGMTPRHGITMMHLAEAGPMGQQALIEALGVDPSVLVAILNDLEGHGLAVRRRDPADRRRHIVELTPAGSVSLATVEAAIATTEKELFADLAGDEIAQLRGLLARVRTSPDDQACTED
jgi:DNA-binding MarR family transcriptional regulator